MNKDMVVGFGLGFLMLCVYKLGRVEGRFEARRDLNKGVLILKRKLKEEKTNE